MANIDDSPKGRIAASPVAFGVPILIRLVKYSFGHA